VVGNTIKWKAEDELKVSAGSPNLLLKQEKKVQSDILIIPDASKDFFFLKPWETSLDKFQPDAGIELTWK